MPAFEPQNCRITILWSSRATHAPGPADAMRGPPVVAGLRAERAVQEMLRAAMSPRDAPWLPGGRAERTGRNARALRTPLARARPASSMLGHWPAEPLGTPPRRAEITGRF
jgi:hypothetical protein